MDAEPSTGSESAADSESGRNYVFRGDDNYRGGDIGRPLGAEADGADIQNHADHVLRKESNKTSRFVSFTEEVKIARKFTSAPDSPLLVKARMGSLREQERHGALKIWDPDQVYEALKQGPKKLAKQAADVRAAMRRNREVLIEGQIPAGIIERVN